nr:immunoglobulin heavy chain junction region [Macaca mulatta]MOX59194.1 immunoglobulin heavy chain junction region [Macaca mulatta]MOX59599.1 immunoglobulin heavy chain junction region [Macaca mulatta]MOX60179.1 immunoglobulin heavy chain junction region [Macaca mulatta]MOX60612.1 immunoglobulin heavy chain junction region [Macaca mulatta]
CARADYEDDYGYHLGYNWFDVW